MANRTVKEAATVKGTNPQYLIEKIIRSRIYDSKFWKEDCFALTGKKTSSGCCYEFVNVSFFAAYLITLLDQ